MLSVLTYLIFSTRARSVNREECILMKKLNANIAVAAVLAFLCGWLINSTVLRYCGYLDSPIIAIITSNLSFFSDLGKVSAAWLLLAVEMMRFLCWMVDHSPTVLGNTHWDLLLCSMLAWLEVRFLSPSSFTLLVCSRRAHRDTFSEISTPVHNQICILNRFYFNTRCKSDLKCFTHMADLINNHTY